MISARNGNKYFFFILLIIMIGSSIIGMFQIATPYRIIMNQYLFMLVPALGIMMFKGSIKERLSIKKLKILDAIFIVIITLLAMRVVTSINIVSSRVFHNFLNDTVKSFGKMGFFQLLFILAITPAICEEVVMRGLVLSEYNNASLMRAAIMNGLLFGLFHMNVNQFLYAFFLGVIMVYVVVITKSILASMLMHFTLNSASVISLWHSQKNLQVSEAANVAGNQLVFSTSFLLLNVIIGVAITLIIVILIREWSKKKSVNLRYINKEHIESRSLENLDRGGIDIWFILVLAVFIFENLAIFIHYGVI